jgi:hypothetical protein
MSNGPKVQKDMYTIEPFRLEAPSTEPIILDRINGEFRDLAEAETRAAALWATVQAAKGAHGFRIIRNGAIVSYWHPADH